MKEQSSHSSTPNQFQEAVFPGSLIDYFRQNWGLASKIAIFMAAATVLYGALFYTPRYASDATVLIKDSALTSKYVTADTDEIKTTSSVMTNPVLNTMALLRSDPISRTLWEYLKAEHPNELKRLRIRAYSDWEDYFENGSRFITAKNMPGTDLIEIRFKWTHPMIAEKGLARVLKTFKETSLKLNQSEQRDKGRYLNHQIDEVKQNLEILRDKIRTFKQKQRTVDIAHESENYASTRLNLETTLKTVVADAASQRSEFGQYENMLDMTTHQAVQASALGGNETLSALYRKLYEANEQYKHQHIRFTDKHPALQAIQSQIRQIKVDIASESKRMTGSPQGDKAVLDQPRINAVTNMMAAKSHERSLNAKAVLLKRYLGELDQKIRTLPQIEKDLATLEEEETTLSEGLQVLQQKALETKMREMQTLSNVFVIDYPNRPHKSSFPSRIQFILLGLLLSVGCSMGVVLLKRKLDILHHPGHDPESLSHREYAFGSSSHGQG